MENLIIRLEEEQDYLETEAVARAAFYRPERIDSIGVGCAEPYMIHMLRGKDGIKELNFVATLDDRIVGHIIYSHSYVQNEDGTELATLNMGPLSVLPAYQKQGIGSALMRHSMAKAKELGYGAILFFGHENYYPRFGFVDAEKYRITDKWGGNYPSFFAYELKEGYLKKAKGKYIESDLYDEEITKGPAKEFEEALYKH